MKINILGTEYTVEERNLETDKYLQERTDIRIILPRSALLMK